MTARSFHLTVLGVPRLEARADPPAMLPPGKPLALITFLACAPNRSATREQLLDLLWADTERDAARHTLRQTLWYVRRRLGTTAFETQGDTVSLALPLTSDRDAFLEALAAENHQAAVACYAGEFFPGFAAAGGAQFEQWADIERRRLCALYVRAAESHIRQRLVALPPRESVALARRGRELAPHLQSSWRLLLETLLAADDMLSAAVEAEELEQWLTRDDLVPEPATSAMLRLVRTSTRAEAAPSESFGLVAEMVGREAVFSRLLIGWEEAKGNRASHLHVAARAGLGKSRLLEGFVRRLKTARARVVLVRALQANRELPFALAADLTLSLAKMRGAAGISPESSGALVALAPGVSTYLSAAPDRATGDDALRRRTFALLELVRTIAEDAPLALLVDDVHWADAASRAMLASLSEGIRDARVLLVSAGRHTNVKAGEHVQHLVLESLTVDQVGTLVEGLARLPDDVIASSWSARLAERLYAATDGSPLLVLETLHLAIERGALARAEGAWQCPNPAVLDETLAGGSAIRQRLLEVPDVQQSTLVLLAVLGTELDEEGVRRVLGEDGVAALPLLEVRGLIAHYVSGWMVAHDEIAALVRELCTPAQLARAHRQSAQLIEAADASSPTQLVRAAQHRRAAGDTREVEQLFTRLVRTSAADGDRRAILALAGDVLGADAPRVERDGLVKALPWRVRANVPRVIVSSMVAAGAVILLSAQLQRRASAPLGGLASDGRPAEVSILIPAIVGTDTLMYGADVGPASMGSGRSVALHEVPVHPQAIRELLKMSPLDRWGDTVVGGSIAYGSEYGIELVQLDLRTGNLVRLTESPTDDHGFSRSPDNTQAAFMSARADTIEEFSSIYVMDRHSGAVRRLTSTRAWDGMPQWSPDGTRIAFMRRFFEPRPTAICTVAVDGSGETCLPALPGYDIREPRAWDSEHTLLMYAELRDSAIVHLLRMDMERGSTTFLRTELETSYFEPGGAVGLAIRPQAGESRMSGVLFSVASRELEAPLSFPRGVDAPMYHRATWDRRRPPARYLGALRFVAVPPTVRPDAFTRLQVAAMDDNARRMPLPPLRWRSLDTTVALVDANSGLLRPRDVGTARLEVSAAGFRPDTQRVTIGPSEFDAPVLKETWETIDSTRWLRFGEPVLEAVRTERNEPALLVNGDGHLLSSVAQRTAVDARAGLGVEARIRAPVTAAHWQRITLSLSYLTDDRFLAAWGRSSDARQPIMPSDWQDADQLRSCRFTFPRAEGGDMVDAVNFHAGGHPHWLKRLPSPITDGEWHTVRLQVLADGRCGVAVDDHVIAMSDRAIPTDKPLRLLIDGQSVGTPMLVGKVTMWRGVRLDMPWFTLADDPPASR